MSLRKAALLVLLGGALAPAIGQQMQPGSPASGSLPKPGDTAAAAPVDESALRYFAAQGDKRRVEAEIARLRSLYPDWSPPADLYGPVSTRDPELDRMWRLFGEGQIGEVRSAIAARQAADPKWQPPAELVTKLNEAEARRRIANAADAKQWASVIALATETPGLLTCGDVATLWRVAEAFARTDKGARARDAYTYVLANCSDTAERLATLQKAMELLPEAEMADLLRLERQGEFAPVRDDLARRRIGRAAQDAKATATADDLATVERLARAGSEAGDALLLGWYLYHHGEAAKALDWFKLALDRGGGAKAAEGYVLTLGALKRGIEAEPVAYQWRDASPDNRKAYQDIVVSLLAADPLLSLDPAILTRFVPVVTQERYASGAQALGWYAYNVGQPRTAASWFETALRWSPDEEPAAYGLAVASLRLNDGKRFNDIVRAWRGRSDRIADLAVAPTRDRRTLARTAPEPAARRAGARVETAVPESEPPAARAPVVVVEKALPTPRSEEGRDPVRTSAITGRAACADAGRGRSALAQGWCLMELDRPLEAAQAFDQVLRAGNARDRQDAAYGKTLAYLRKGLTDQAAIAATQAPQPRERRAELGSVILTQRAIAAFRDKRYAEAILALDARARLVPEQNDLLVLRGWSYFNLGRFDDAERIFKAVALTGHPDGRNGQAAIAAATRRFTE